MAISANKLAPSAVVLAFVGYCIWPSVSELSGGAVKPKSPTKVAELSAALLSPTMPRRPTKSPWGGRDAATLAAIKSGTTTIAGDAGGKPGGNFVDPLVDIKLEATCIVGNRRLAVINGRLYAAQDILTPPRLESPPCKVVSVLPYKVLLECGGRTVTLTYSDVASAAASPKNKPGSPATASAAKPPAIAAAGVKSSMNEATKKTGK